MKIDLSGRVALVTGSTRGIGRAIAGTLAECGARVAVVGRDQAKAEAVAAELGGDAKGFSCDLSEVAQAAALVENVEKAFGSVDILVNNAGLTKDNILLRLKDDDWDAVLNANLRAAFATIRAATRGMMKRRWGRIINMSSVVGLIGNKGQANYAASKAGLIGLTKSVAKEFASRLCSHPLRAIGVFGQAINVSRERGGVAGRKEPSCLAVADQFRHGAQITCNDGSSTRKCFGE